MTLRRYDANGRLLEDAEPDGLAYFVRFADYQEQEWNRQHDEEESADLFDEVERLTENKGYLLVLVGRLAAELEACRRAPSFPNSANELLADIEEGSGVDLGQSMFERRKEIRLTGERDALAETLDSFHCAAAQSGTLEALRASGYGTIVDATEAVLRNVGRLQL